MDQGQSPGIYTPSGGPPFSSRPAFSPSPAYQTIPKKSKKPLLIGIILVITAFFVGVIIFVLTSSSSPLSSSQSALAKFRNYANYLLYDVDNSTAALKPYDQNTDYRLQSILASQDSSAKTAYFAHAQDLFTAFHSTFQGDDDTTSLVQDYAAALSFMAKLANFTAPSDRQLTQTHLDSDANTLDQKLPRLYSTFSNLDSAPAQEYVKYSVARDKSKIILLQIYRANNCLDDDLEVSPDCSITDTAIASQISQYSDEMDSDDSYLYNLSLNTEQQLIDDCWEIEKALTTKGANS